MVMLSLIIQLNLSSVNTDQKLDNCQARIIKVSTTSLCSKCFNTFGISFTGETKRLFSFFHDFENALTPSVSGQQNFELYQPTFLFSVLAKRSIVKGR